MNINRERKSREVAKRRGENRNDQFVHGNMFKFNSMEKL